MTTTQHIWEWFKYCSHLMASESESVCIYRAALQNWNHIRVLNLNAHLQLCSTKFDEKQHPSLEWLDEKVGWYENELSHELTSGTKNKLQTSANKASGSECVFYRTAGVHLRRRSGYRRKCLLALLFYFSVEAPNCSLKSRNLHHHNHHHHRPLKCRTLPIPLFIMFQPGNFLNH